MKVLLDTHIVLWSAAEPERLGGTADLIGSAEVRYLSAASTWELAIKQSHGRVDVGDVDAWVARALRELAADPLPVTHRHAAGVVDLPWSHHDPFDRLLVAQARQEGAVLVTADRSLDGYGHLVDLAHP